jgi:hypothetical protein
MRRHAVEPHNRAEVVDPRLLRANKSLSARNQFISLAQRSNPHGVGFWLIANRCRIERRAAVRTETLRTDVAAIGSLSIFRRFAGQKHERARTSDNNRSQRSAAHCLAIGAVANCRCFRISFGFERNVATMAASIDFHDSGPLHCSHGVDDSRYPNALVGSRTGQAAKNSGVALTAKLPQ